MVPTGWSLVEDDRRSALASAEALFCTSLRAVPKSAICGVSVRQAPGTLTASDFVNRMFGDLRSRWTRSRECRYAIPCAISPHHYLSGCTSAICRAQVRAWGQVHAREGFCT